MYRNTWWGKTLRTIATVLMGITALFTIAGGLGTTCVALSPAAFGESMARLAPFQWLYITFVVVTTTIGVMAARAMVLMARGSSNAYRYAIIALVLGAAIGVFHMLVSRGLRGASMPVDAVVYTTLLTLIVLLIIRIPGIWQGADFTSGDPGEGTGKTAAAITLLVTAILTLSVQFWAGPSHTWGGTNWAGAFASTTLLFGLAQGLGGLALLPCPCMAWLRKRGFATAD